MSKISISCMISMTLIHFYKTHSHIAIPTILNIQGSGGVVEMDVHVMYDSMTLIPFY